jgi:hypothetical protein
MLVPALPGDIWSVARYASQCDVHTKLDVVWGQSYVLYGSCFKRKVLSDIEMWGQVIMGDKRPC